MKNCLQYLWLIILILLTFHPQVFANNIGNRAIGFGGAYTALADDASSTWYNPAGLSKLHASSLSISATAYAYSKFNYNNFITFNHRNVLDSKDFYGDSVKAYPTSLIYSQIFNAGGLRHGIGFSILIPESSKSRGGINFSSSNDVIQMTFETDEEYTEYYLGPSYSLQYKNLSFGISPFIRYLTKDYSYSLFENTTTQTQDPYISSKIFSEEYTNLLFTPRIGIQAEFASGFKAGFVFIPESTEIAGTTKINRMKSVAGSEVYQGVDAHIQEQIDTRMDTVVKLPWITRLGLAYEKPGHFSIEFTVEASGKVSPYLDREKFLPESTEAEHNLINIEEGYNFNLGAEYCLREKLKIRGGIFTKYANHPSFDKSVSLINGNTAAGDHFEDIIGLNLGLATENESRKTSYNISVLKGSGEALGFYITPPDLSSPMTAGDPLHEKSVKVIKTSSWQVAFLISTSFAL